MLEILADGEVVENPNFKTTFTYLPETEQEKAYVSNSYRDIEDYIPLVLTINSRLKSFKIISAENEEIVFVLSSKEMIPNEHGVNLYKNVDFEKWRRTGSLFYH